MTTSLQATLEHRLAALVAQPTVTHDVAANRDAIAALAKELGSYGMHVHVDGPNHPWVIATTRATRHPKILLAAHIDVVEPTSVDQYTMRIQDGKIIGRGTFDMKFAIACYMEFVRNLAARGTLHDYDFGIFITSDEEKGGYDGTKEWLDQGWRTDLAVIPDGGRDWKIEERAKGLLYGYLDASGEATHSSRPWEGKNAIHALVSGLQEVIVAFPNTDPHGMTVSVNVVETSGAGRINVTQVPNRARASIDVRAFTTAEITKARAVINKIAARHGLTFTVALDEPPVQLDKSHPLVQDFVECLADVREQPVAFTSAYGASDARHLAAYGVPTVLLYPTGGEAHSATEWMAREDLSTFYHVVEAYITRAAHAARDAEPSLANQLHKYTQLITRSLHKR